MSPNCENMVIQAAYKALARKYHPDLNKSAGADSKIRKLNEAYDVLGNQSRRTAYDRARAQRFEEATRTETAKAPTRTRQAKFTPLRPPKFDLDKLKSLAERTADKAIDESEHTFNGCLQALLLIIGAIIAVAFFRSL